ncbi:hypothetical protein HC766_04595 [Candidatus Gracilibacteria bacterium]|nr:hypothetical protein [Candidatus Gracilibacteria bacterium]NJS41595.1 hypothetical protein [Candidatus Gracilibacteria bacterium]
MNKDVEKILTKNFGDKKGVNISKAKYDQVKNMIMDKMKKQDTITMSELSEYVKSQLKNFDGKVGWYFMAVKLDLEVKNLIERVPNKLPQTLRLK